ncbi:phosphatase PAP2 family protein [Oceanobacillus piezotolerans]|uniref:Phosphatase PAP2 family protein n=1 Tax=Oceanobacillus piezotolerans TaxID=2448030 RepID=A0A498D8S0_9BACI|nr:phosphatase PAP2 family protein [Oceanobacillus piezotolerans]RLL45021.1 phosphatase PAP2 family protein [Oceanobacillus piezotolerans]
MFSERKGILLVLLMILVAMTCIWMIQIVNGSVPLLDQWTRELASQAGGTFVYNIFLTITHLGSRGFLIPFVISMSIVLWVLLKNMKAPIIFAFGTLLTYYLNSWIKQWIERERPSILEEARGVGYSFPSGHAMISIVCYGLLAYFITRKLKSKHAIICTQVGFSLVILLIGISRYFINVHYLTDIIAGFNIGYLCLIALTYLYERLQRERYRSRD